MAAQVSDPRALGPYPIKFCNGPISDAVLDSEWLVYASLGAIYRDE